LLTVPKRKHEDLGHAAREAALLLPVNHPRTRLITMKSG